MPLCFQLEILFISLWTETICEIDDKMSMWQVYSRPRALCSSLAWGMSTTCFGATKSAGRGRGRWSGGAILWDSVVRRRGAQGSCSKELLPWVLSYGTSPDFDFLYLWICLGVHFDRTCIWYPVKAVNYATRLTGDKVIGVSGRRMTGGVASGGMVGKIDPGRKKHQWMKLTEGSRKCSKKLRHKACEGVWWDWLEFSLRLEMHLSVFFHAGWQQSSSQCEPTALTRARSSSTLWRAVTATFRRIVGRWNKRRNRSDVRKKFARQNFEQSENRRRKNVRRFAFIEVLFCPFPFFLSIYPLKIWHHFKASLLPLLGRNNNRLVSKRLLKPANERSSSVWKRRTANESCGGKWRKTTRRCTWKSSRLIRIHYKYSIHCTFVHYVI